jgi:energy-converting hydrogenase Eha subunit C
LRVGGTAAFLEHIATIALKGFLRYIATAAFLKVIATAAVLGQIVTIALKVFPGDIA